MNSTPRGAALCGFVKCLSPEVMMIPAQGCAATVAVAAARAVPAWPGGACCVATFAFAMKTFGAHRRVWRPHGAQVANGSLTVQ